MYHPIAQWETPNPAAGTAWLINGSTGHPHALPFTREAAVIGRARADEPQPLAASQKGTWTQKGETGVRTGFPKQAAAGAFQKKSTSGLRSVRKQQLGGR